MDELLELPGGHLCVRVRVLSLGLSTSDLSLSLCSLCHHTSPRPLLGQPDLWIRVLTGGRLPLLKAQQVTEVIQLLGKHGSHSGHSASLCCVDVCGEYQ